MAALQQTAYHHINFIHSSAEMRANGLLGSAKPGHIEPIDRNAVENTDDSIKAGGAHTEFSLD